MVVQNEKSIPYVDRGVTLCLANLMPLNLNHRDDKNKIKLLALEISSVAAEVFGMGEADIGQLAPILDKAIEQMLLDWLEKNK